VGTWIDQDTSQIATRINPHVTRILGAHSDMCPTNNNLGVTCVRAEGTTPYWYVVTQIGFVHVRFAFSDKLKLHLEVRHERGPMYFHDEFAGMLRYSCNLPVIVV